MRQPQNAKHGYLETSAQTRGLPELKTPCPEPGKVTKSHRYAARYAARHANEHRDVLKTANSHCASLLESGYAHAEHDTSRT